jgi:hypothetical protein
MTLFSYVAAAIKDAMGGRGNRHSSDPSASQKMPTVLPNRDSSSAFSFRPEELCALGTLFWTQLAISCSPPCLSLLLYLCSFLLFVFTCKVPTFETALACISRHPRRRHFWFLRPPTEGVELPILHSLVVIPSLGLLVSPGGVPLALLNFFLASWLFYGFDPTRARHSID